MQDSFTKEQVLEAYNRAPEFVRAAFNDERTTALIVNFRDQYQLHVDAAGTLGKEVGYLLLGLTNPAAFAVRLEQRGFSRDLVGEISKKLNAEIFAPLHEKMRQETGRTSSLAPAQMLVQPPQRLAPPLAYRPAQEPSQVVIPAQRPQPAIPSAPPRPAPVPSASSVAPSAPQFRPNVGAPLPPKTAMPGAVPNPPAASSPRPVPPVPQNLPGVMREPVQDVKPEGAFPRTYLVDPYREPPE